MQRGELGWAEVGTSILLLPKNVGEWHYKQEVIPKMFK